MPYKITITEFHKSLLNTLFKCQIQLKLGLILKPGKGLLPI